MVFLMPGEKAETAAKTAPGSKTPREIVGELDKYVIGQQRAKKAVAVALRNRWRRQQLDPEMSREILPKNILMIGPTGVGKTEIARRLARLADAPFIKVEASKFTEVGYVGRDVESIVRDLTEVAVHMVREEKTAEIRDRAKARTEQRLVELLMPPLPDREAEETRGKLRMLLREGKLDDRLVEVEVADKTFPSFEIVTNQGVEEMDINVKEMLPGLFGSKKKRRKATVAEAREILQAEEEGRLVDPSVVAREAVERAQSAGIVFLDEIDKVAGRESGGRGPDVSREGVQRDLLPIVEGTSVNTKYGFVKTDHVLFIAAGAFHVSKPSDLIPELQGRFPIRVELDSLTEEDFVRILSEPENALSKQYHALLTAENVDLQFSDEAIREIARDAERVNRSLENIGARRLHTILERLLEEISFAGPENAGKTIRSRSTTSSARWPTWSKTRTCRATYSEEVEQSTSRQLTVRSPRSLDRSIPIILPALVAVGALPACGKKGDPQPPLPRGPRAISDLAVEQEAGDAVLIFSYPDRLLDGQPLTDLASIEIYRVVNVSPALVTTPRRSFRAPRRRPTDGAGRGRAARRGGGQRRPRRKPSTARRSGSRSLPVAELARRTRGATIVYRGPPRAAAQGRQLPSSLAYAIVSVRRGGREKPALEHRHARAGCPARRADAPRASRRRRAGSASSGWSRTGTCSAGPTRSAATSSTAARSRRRNTTRPLNAKPVKGTRSWTSARLRLQLVYTVRATLPTSPNRGPPAEEAAVDYRDVFPPAGARAPRRALGGCARAPGVGSRGRAGPRRVRRLPLGGSRRPCA